MEVQLHDRDHDHHRQEGTVLHVVLHVDEHLQEFLKTFHNQLSQLTGKVDFIMATQAEVAQQLRDVLARQQKTSGEITTLQGSVDTLNAKVAELQAVIAGMGTDASPELVDAANAVDAQSKVVDDQIPDVVVPTP